MDESHEEWRAVVGYEGFYEVSSLGRVRSLDRLSKHRYGGTKRQSGRLLASSLPGSGRFPYATIRLCRDGVPVSHKVHILVARAFIGLPSNGHEVRHLDGKPSNNRKSNLAYGTRVANMADARLHGTLAVGENLPQAMLTAADVLKIRELSETMGQTDIAIILGFSRSTVKDVLHRRTWKHVK